VAVIPQRPSSLAQASHKTTEGLERNLDVIPETLHRVLDFPARDSSRVSTRDHRAVGSLQAGGASGLVVSAA
jgi:hypothetical protein